MSDLGSVITLLQSHPELGIVVFVVAVAIISKNIPNLKRMLTKSNSPKYATTASKKTATAKKKKTLPQRTNNTQNANNNNNTNVHINFDPSMFTPLPPPLQTNKAKKNNKR